MYDSLYLEQAFCEDPRSVSLSLDILEQVKTGIKLLFAYRTVIFVVIFAVKFSFLSFFRPLVRRLARLTVWWNCVAVTTILGGVFCAVNVYIICPHFDLSASRSFRHEYLCS